MAFQMGFQTSFVFFLLYSFSKILNLRVELFFFFFFFFLSFSFVIFYFISCKNLKKKKLFEMFRIIRRVQTIETYRTLRCVWLNFGISILLFMHWARNSICNIKIKYLLLLIFYVFIIFIISFIIPDKQLDFNLYIFI